jgi:hypothetical protein
MLFSSPLSTRPIDDDKFLSMIVSINAIYYARSISSPVPGLFEAGGNLSYFCEGLCSLKLDKHLRPASEAK